MNDEQTMTNSNSTGALICHKCDASFPIGVAHYCPTVITPTPQPRWVPPITFYACPHGGAHDFAIGPTHAICNRCEKTVQLPAAVSAEPADNQ